jgi:DNA-directed RNA polymerase
MRLKVFFLSATRARRRYDNAAYGQYYRFSSTDDATSETIFTDRPDLDQIYSEIFWGATNKYVSRFEPIPAQTKFTSIMKWKKAEVRAFCNNIAGDVSATATPITTFISQNRVKIDLSFATDCILDCCS